MFNKKQKIENLQTEIDFLNKKIKEQEELIARKNDEYSKLSEKNRNNVTENIELFAQTSLSEFVNKYKEYKDKQDNEIKVGDVVQLTVKEAIVTDIAGCDAYLLFRDGSSNKFTKDNFTKTSRHYDSIDAFMNS